MNHTRYCPITTLLVGLTLMNCSEQNINQSESGSFTKISGLLPFLVVMSAWLILDVWSKQWAQSVLAQGSSKDLIRGWLSLAYVRNYAGAWGFLSFMAETSRSILLTSMSVVSIVIVCILFFSSAREDVKARLGLASLLGGALGNLQDRIRWGYVVDFIDWQKGVDWPVFNIADIAITVGIFLLAWDILGEKQSLQNKTDKEV